MTQSWWRRAVIYQVYIRSFADGNGDGIGDIAGLRARLPYLAELGVDAIWVNPWYPSPMKDAGYDVSDFRSIEPVFGTLAEAQALHRRGPRPGPASTARHRAQSPLRPAPRGSRRRWPRRRDRASARASSSVPAAAGTERRPRTTGTATSVARPGHA